MTSRQKKIRDEEIVAFLQFRNRAHKIESKKGKGYKYNRAKEKKMLTIE